MYWGCVNGRASFFPWKGALFVHAHVATYVYIHSHQVVCVFVYECVRDACKLYSGLEGLCRDEGREGFLRRDGQSGGKTVKFWSASTTRMEKRHPAHQVVACVSVLHEEGPWSSPTRSSMPLYTKAEVGLRKEVRILLSSHHCTLALYRSVCTYTGLRSLPRTSMQDTSRYIAQPRFVTSLLKTCLE